MKIVGTSRPIHDAAGKAAGFTRYAADIFLPNMAYLVLIRSTIPHGRVTAVHAEKALAMEGVYGVYHCLNTEGRAFNRYRSHFDQASLPQEERVFNEYVRFVGDRIGVVAAVDQQTAERAAKLVEVEYEAYAFSTGFDDTLEGKGCLPGESIVLDDFVTEVGTAPEGDDLIAVTTQTELPRLHHAAMEPHVSVADYDPYEEVLTIYSPNQSVHGIRTVIADLLEMPQSHVRVVKTTMGGSFGAKQEWFTEPVAATMAVILRRPVKLVYSRAESMSCAVVRAAMRCEVKGLFSRDGALRSIDVELLLDAGAYFGNSGDYVRSLSGKLVRCYKSDHVQFHSRVISSNTPVSGAYRGWSAPETAIIMERHMDEAARVLGIDRVALRVRNAQQPGTLDPKNGVPFEDIRIAEAITSGAEQFGWEKLQRDDAAFNISQTRYRRGVGIGCGGHGNTYFPRTRDYGEALLQLNADGTVQASLTLHDHGCGSVVMARMIIAEVLDLPESSIYLREGDTENTPIDFGCFASRTTFVLGRTIENAARSLRELMLRDASELYGKQADELYLEGGFIKSRADAALAVPVATLAVDSMRRYGRNLRVLERHQNQSNPGVAGAHFAHVEVDTWTGFTRVLDYLAVQDIGQAINPGMCEAQVQGAVQMGCGAALREKLTIDANGRCTQSLSKYHLFLAPELPDIQVRLLMDGRSAEGPFGAKSIGEICYVPVAAAVCGAVNDALDSALPTLPYDPDCILKYIKKEMPR